ncbi:MAG: NAD(P)H-dependent oxidoreductase, partial [Aeromonas molluscorum]
MIPNLLVINGNPKPDSLCHALAREYVRSAEASGARVTLLHIGELAFEPDLRHGYDRLPPLEPDLQRLQQSLTAAQHLVIISPVWWGSMPARLKGVLDRTLLPGFAFRYQKGKVHPERLLAGKTARLLLTM